MLIFSNYVHGESLGHRIDVTTEWRDRQWVYSFISILSFVFQLMRGCRRSIQSLYTTQQNDNVKILLHSYFTYGSVSLA